MPDLSPFLAPNVSPQQAQHLDPNFQIALMNMITAGKAAGRTIGIRSAWRDPQQQSSILNDSLVKRFGPDAGARWQSYLHMAGGDPVRAGEAARPWLKSIGETAWVAPPGSSNHQKGLASDLSFGGPQDIQWAHNNATQFGMNFPMANENWHVEPIGARAGVSPGMAAATNAGRGIGPIQRLIQPSQEMSPGMAAATVGATPTQNLASLFTQAPTPANTTMPPTSPSGGEADLASYGGGGSSSGGASGADFGDTITLRPFNNPDPGNGGQPLGPLAQMLAQQTEELKRQQMAGAQPVQRGQVRPAPVFIA